VEFGKSGDGHWRYAGWVTFRSPGLELNDIGYMRQGDIIMQVLWAGYRIWEPFSIFRRVNINFNQWAGWDFSGTNYFKGININGNLQFKNYWSLVLGMDRNGKAKSKSELRGGPTLNFPGAWSNWWFVSTDERKKLVFELYGWNYWRDLDSQKIFDLGFDVNWRPMVSLGISLGPSYQKAHNVAQYVETVEQDDGDKYIVARIDRSTLMANLRVNFSITPDLSIQYWGQPFIFAADYSEFKLVDNPGASDFYDQFHQYNENEIYYDPENEEYNIDDNGDGTTDYSFENPDFKVYEFRSNLVLRWEYIPGSTLFVVWSQGRSDDSSQGYFQFNQDMNNLFNVFPNDVFLVKLTYRLSFS
jgi:hypothetical protein